MYPSTPTPLPPGMPNPLNLNVTMWDYTDDAIQSWHLAGDLATGFQALILLFLISLILVMLYATARRISVEKD